MDTLYLVSPSPQYFAQIRDYKEEFLADDSLDGAAGLDQHDDIASWYEAVRDNAREETVRPGLVPAATFLCLRRGDERLVGMIDIRLRLNENLLRRGGHIGYSVRKSERRKGYATEMLRLGLEQCRQRGIDRVLLTCDKNNVASAKTILANGGVLENEVPEEDRTTQRYWITA